MSSIDEIKHKLDIVDLISETVNLRRSGKNYTGFCPFHDNKRTPAFVVFPDTGTWRCFGQCSEGGDIYNFVMKREGWDFQESLQRLAEKAGVVLKPPTQAELQQKEENEHLRELLDQSVTFFIHHLNNTEAGKSARTYLLQRGISEKTMEVFNLGLAPDKWDTLLTHLTDKGIDPKVMLEAGLLSSKDDGTVFDRFRGRIMFPIYDGRGKMAGFGARTLKKDGLPKFLNSPETPVFNKGKLLYGLNKARKSIRQNDQAVIVEGYLDVIALHQHGFDNVVSPMGTALTEHQLQTIKRFTRNIVLALDADVAGEKATLRGLEVARSTMDREQEIVFDARGLIHHEARLKADIRVTALPEGLDPDDVVNKSPADWEDILNNAKPIVQHVMDTVSVGKNLDDPKQKIDIANQVLPLIEDIDNPIERDTYRQRLARLLKIDPSVLPVVKKRPLRGRTRARQPSQAPIDAIRVQEDTVIRSHTRKIENYCLGCLIRYPDLLYDIDRFFKSENIDVLKIQDFQYSDNQVLMQLIRDSINQSEYSPEIFILNQVPDELEAKVSDLLKSSRGINTDNKQYKRDIYNALVQLRRNSYKQQIEQLQSLQEAAHEDGDRLTVDYQQSLLSIIKELQKIDIAIKKVANTTGASENITYN